MGVYNRSEGTGLSSNWWIDYYITREMASRFNVSTRFREAANTTNKAAAERMLAQRKREVKAGTWHPRPMAARMSLADWSEVALSEMEAQGIRSVRDYRSRLRDHVLPRLGKRPMGDITRAEVKEVVAGLVAAGTHAPRTIHNIYDALRQVYQRAMEHQPPLVLETPCTLKVVRGELPRKRDKDPRWRVDAVWQREEIERLLGAPRDKVPMDRLAFYAVELLAGARIGEVAGLQVRDYQPRHRPLGKLLIAEQAQGDVRWGLKGDAPPREVPVHPVLADILDEWVREGLPALLKRSPRPDDLLIPSRLGRARSKRHMLTKLGQDLDRLELPKRTNHDARRTLISLAQADGADTRAIHAITHRGRATETAGVQQGYTIWGWEALCEAIAALRIFPVGWRTGGPASGEASGGSPVTDVVTGSTRKPKNTQNLDDEFPPNELQTMRVLAKSRTGSGASSPVHPATFSPSFSGDSEQTTETVTAGVTGGKPGPEGGDEGRVLELATAAYQAFAAGDDPPRWLMEELALATLEMSPALDARTVLRSEGKVAVDAAARLAAWHLAGRSKASDPVRGVLGTKAEPVAPKARGGRS